MKIESADTEHPPPPRRRLKLIGTDDQGVASSPGTDPDPATVDAPAAELSAVDRPVQAPESRES
jgi:hypothetical protein